MWENACTTTILASALSTMWTNHYLKGVGTCALSKSTVKVLKKMNDQEEEIEKEADEDDEVSVSKVLDIVLVSRSFILILFLLYLLSSDF